MGWVMGVQASYLWFRRIALIASILALCVVVLGAYVRLSDAGLGCPDWPGCYGALSVPESQSAIAHAQSVFPDKPVVAHKAWKEMIHRYVAGTLGLLVFSLGVLGWRARRLISVSPWTPTALVAVIALQAALGMWTVTLLLKPVIVSAHLMGGMTTLALLVWIAHRHFGTILGSLVKGNPLRWMIRGALIVIFAQIFLGGWTSSNYAALACTDFPTCHGEWLPTMDFGTAFHWVRELGQSASGEPLALPAFVAIQWTHRVGALITLIYLASLALMLLKNERLRSFGKLLLVLLCLQILMGIGNLVLHLPLPLAVGHNLGAALLLMTIVVINSKITGALKGSY
jgi:cytochrome c oxidase assembly protein subunit 15